MTRVKICGMTREADVRAAADAGADAVGFVSDVPVETPREVDPERAAALVRETPPFVSTVLVTMPESPEDVVSLAETISPDVIQIHDGLAPEGIRALSETTDTNVVAAVDATEPERARRFAAVADALLIDSADANGAGGTGRTHDWERTYESTRALATPVILAGGLAPGNVAAAVRAVRPFAVDVATGVEAEPGVKDHDAMRAFVRNATDAMTATP